jgi:hypothetical protein
MHHHGTRYVQTHYVDMCLHAYECTITQVHLMFGRTVDKPLTGNGLTKMYKVFLDATSVSSKKKSHLARQAVPGIMEDMGFVLAPLFSM